MRRLSLLVVLSAVVLAGCSSGTSNATKELTERQRDSLIARSALPGASVVGHALATTDREASRASAMNAGVDSLFH